MKMMTNTRESKVSDVHNHTANNVSSWQPPQTPLPSQRLSYTPPPLVATRFTCSNCHETQSSTVSVSMRLNRLDDTAE